MTLRLYSVVQEGREHNYAMLFMYICRCNSLPLVCENARWVGWEMWLLRPQTFLTDLKAGSNQYLKCLPSTLFGITCRIIRLPMQFGYFSSGKYVFSNLCILVYVMW